MRWIGFVAATIVAVAGFSAPVYANLNDFVINDFTADYSLSNDDRQGRLDVTESIAVTFTDNNHGIERAIPQKYKGGSLHLKIQNVSSQTNAPAQFMTYSSGENTVVRIGDPNRTVTGKQQYTIHYQLENVISFYDDHAEFYWDVNGVQWDQPAEAVTLRLHNGYDTLATKCFAGLQGATAQDCTISSTDNITTFKATNLPANATLTALISYPPRYFYPATFTDWLREHVGLILAVVLPPIIAGLWAFRRWARYGKDLKGRGVIVPEYDVPDALTPAEIGTVYNYRLQTKDISATLIDLAIRKYIKITEIHQKKLLKDTKTYQFELINADVAGLRNHEVEVLTALFPGMKAGTVTDLKVLKVSFVETAKKLQSDVPKSLTEAGYFFVDPKKAGTRMYVVAFVLVFIAFMIHAAVSVGIGIAAVVVFLFAVQMPKRTEKGVAAKDHIAGLKMYLGVAEKDRIAMLQSPDAPYAAQTNEPIKTVELFEKLLPAAIVLGVEKKWADKFQDIYTTPPDWYVGNWTAFNAGYFVASLNDSVGAMDGSFSPSSDSSSSGFSGGGFSGGGGGGGGGGGW